ncbi:hypothetical protein MYXO_00905 [Myxococcaceae bacterium]|jgi:hypothetical protein|nr:hypothetical protein MYXO_00905 [Myxococcaceae bacterium]
MTLGGVFRGAVVALGATIGLFVASRAAADEPRAAGAPDAAFFAPGARLSDPLPTFRDLELSAAASSGLPLRTRPLPSLPGRAGASLPLEIQRSQGVPLYGLLAGRALLAALDAGEVLPAAASPWFDGNPDRMVAGIEFSF